MWAVLVVTPTTTVQAKRKRKWPGRHDRSRASELKNDKLKSGGNIVTCNANLRYYIGKQLSLLSGGCLPQLNSCRMQIEESLLLLSPEQSFQSKEDVRIPQPKYSWSLFQL